MTETPSWTRYKRMFLYNMAKQKRTVYVFRNEKNGAVLFNYGISNMCSHENYKLAFIIKPKNN